MQYAIQIAEPSAKERALSLSKNLQLPIFDEANPIQPDFILSVTKDCLQLITTREKNTKPFYIDFTAIPLQQRSKLATKKTELIARAVGHNIHKPLTIIDATAGLGRDAFILANLGHTLHLIEASPIISVLLKDGIERLQKTNPFYNDCFKLYTGKAEYHLPKIFEQHSVDVVYLDPMYPPRTKSALVKKEMQWLQKIVDEKENAKELLELAKSLNAKRVVIKRPVYAPLVDSPDIVYQGKNHRFEVY